MKFKSEHMSSIDENICDYLKLNLSSLIDLTRTNELTMGSFSPSIFVKGRIPNNYNNF